MHKKINLITILCLAAAVISSILFSRFHQDIYLTFAITFGTICYHLGMRLLVGGLFDIGMNNRADYTKKWYQTHSWENKLYQILKVKKWKDKMPTYQPELFSCRQHTWDEIAQAMCQSELTHETCALLSFLPLIASKWFGAFYVFLITSVCSAAFDLMLVIMQRYNRNRIMKIISKKR